MNKHTNVKLFMDAYTDKISQYQTNNIYNNITPSFSYNENIFRQFAPAYANGFFQMTNTNKNSQLVFLAATTYKKYRENDLLQSTIDYKTNTNSLFKRGGLGINYSLKLNTKSALQFTHQFTSDSKPQELFIMQDSARDLNGILTTRQNSSARNTILNNNTEIKFFVKSRADKLIQFGISNTNTRFGLRDSLLINNTAGQWLSPDSLKNDITLNSNDARIYALNNISFGKLRIGANIGVDFISQNFVNANGKILPTSKRAYFTPAMNLDYKVDAKNNFNATLSFNNDFPNLSSLNDNALLSGYRLFNYGNFINTRVNNIKTTVLYNYQNTSKGESLILSWYRFSQLKTLLTNVEYQKDFDYNFYSFIKGLQNINNYYMKYDRYFFKLKTGLTIKNSFTYINFPVAINNIIYSNKNLLYTGLVSVRPTFIKDINTSFGLEYTLNRDFASNRSTWQVNPYLSLTANLFKNFSIGTSGNLFVNNYYSSTKKYLFANAMLWYTLKPGKLDLKATLFNVANTLNVLTGSKNAILDRAYSVKSLPRFALIQLDFKF